MIPEISLVDRPCLPSAKFLLRRRSAARPASSSRSIDGYLLIKADRWTPPATSRRRSGEADEVDLIAIARDALSQWLAQEASRSRRRHRRPCSSCGSSATCSRTSTGPRRPTSTTTPRPPSTAVKALLTTPAQEADDVNLNKIATLTKAATAARRQRDDKAAVAELRKALGIDDLDTKITAEVTKAASAEDLEKVALRLAKVETTAMTNGPVRVPTLMDTARRHARNDALNKAPSTAPRPHAVNDRATAAAYMQIADELEATIPTV
jgi:hypothetical protein